MGLRRLIDRHDRADAGQGTFAPANLLGLLPCFVLAPGP